MSDDKPQTNAVHQPPAGTSKDARWRDLDYTVTSRWLVLRKKDKPTAEIFHTSYVAKAADPKRPVTFVFNGGPGAASVYLHVGAVGPQRVDFPSDGSLPAAPIRLVENDESWLAFTDLVFVDPVGTGFSRFIETDGQADETKKGEKPDPKQYFAVKSDLDAMCEFIWRWLSENGRWGSPVFLAGESYGGYRVGRLTRLLQERGVGLSGSILISPALEPAYLSIFFGGGDYEVAPWIDLVPTMAAAAAYHGKSRVFTRDTPILEILNKAEAFATGDYVLFLAQGAAMPEDERDRILTFFADLVGLDRDYVVRAEGRIGVNQFSRELLRSERKVVGRYDATVIATDPFPDRDLFGGADPTLAGLTPTFTAAVNRLLRETIGVQTDREYKIIEYEVIQAWKNDEALHYVQQTHGAADDFRYGLAMNPHMKAFITHGLFDLVTPYYTTNRIRNLMRLDPSIAARLTLRHFHGGHMFYTWQDSRRAFTNAIGEFMASCITA